MRKVLYILGQLDDADVEWMAEVGYRERVADGQVLIPEGQEIDAIYIVLEGEVTVDVAGLGEIARLGCGEIVGEMSFVDARPPSATVAASGEGQVLRLDRGVLLDRLKTDDAFASRFYHAIAVFLADRLRETVVRLGYGEVERLSDAAEIRGELDDHALEHLHLAGGRFSRLLELLLGR
ncbi:MAG TPA: cyclic nucleotide-binding domain-containing protein [Geminicoccaceae bacterium]|jgi:CRP-like cAMP-binding protein|nr:cyclic nucleotide-binding domain-containing protein [Geminicoccaceae bacterium]